MRLNSYAPTSSLEILLWSSSCKWKGNLAHQQSQEDPDVAHQRLVQGLSVAEVVEAGVVPGSCNLGSYNSEPAKVGTLLHATQWAKGVLGMICTCIKDRNPTEQIYSTSFALTLLLPHLIVVGVSGGVILAAL